MARTVYLSCELKARDLDSRFLLTCHLLKAGFEVVVGQHWSIIENLGQCPKGVVLFKTPNRVQIAGMAIARQHGHVVIAMDEEAMAVVGPLAIRLPTDPTVFDVAHSFLFQNASHQAAFARPGPIVGNIRVDLLRSMRSLYAEIGAEHRARGRYILINTNCTLANSIWKSPEAALKTTLKVWQADLSDPAIKDYVEGWQAAENANVAITIAFLRQLAPRLRDVRIVVRPHPAEDPESWKSLSGVEVVSGSNPIPWILGADLTVHCNSTTGLEAALMDRPCLNLNAVGGLSYSQTIATNNSDFQASTAEEGVAKALDVLAGKTHTGDHGWIPEFAPNASELVATEIARNAISDKRVARWTRIARDDFKKSKFDVSQREATERFNLIRGQLNVPNFELKEIDDSLFHIQLA